MAADIAVAERAEDRIGDRMAQHVGVGMADEALIVRNLDAAEPDMIAGPEGVDVIALARSHIFKRADEFGLGHGEILRSGDLHIGLLAFENINGMAGPFRDRRVVGEAGLPGFRGLAMSGEDEIELERLRRLHRAQAFARRCRDNAALRVDLLDRIGQRKPRHGGAMRAPRLSRAADQAPVRKRPRAIVDQNNLRCVVRGEGFEPVSDADLPRLAAEGRWQQAGACLLGEIVERRLVERGVVGVDRGQEPALRARPEASAEIVCVNKGLPATARYCLGRPPPARVPRPAATTRIARSDVSLMAQVGFPMAGRAAVLSLFAAVVNVGLKLRLDAQVVVAALHKLSIVEFD